jgi:YesN/AraC family two-component response regulator
MKVKKLQALQVGLQGYILKPLDPKVILAKLKEIESTIAG